MKPLHTLLASLLLSTAAFAADIALSDGRVLKDASIVSQKPRNVTVKHAGGLTSVAKVLLPADLQAKYPVDEFAAQQADLRDIEARQKAYTLQQAEAERVARLKEERAKNIEAHEANQTKEANRQALDAARAKAGAKILAERHFTQNHSWSPGETNTCEVTIYDARPVEGWPGRWNVTGRAFIKRYDNNQTSYNNGTPNKNVGGVAETSIDSTTPKPVRHRYTQDGNYTIQTQDFEAVYSADSGDPSLSVTLR